MADVMKIQATAKYTGTSARKVGLVAALIRGRKVSEAEQILQFAPQRATELVGQTLRSAVANATNNLSLKKGDLVVESVFVGPAPMLKRFRPRAQGRAGRIMKRTSHITVVISQREKATSTKGGTR